MTDARVPESAHRALRAVSWDLHPWIGTSSTGNPRPALLVYTADPDGAPLMPRVAKCFGQDPTHNTVGSIGPATVHPRDDGSGAAVLAVHDIEREFSPGVEWCRQARARGGTARMYVALRPWPTGTDPDTFLAGLWRIREHSTGLVTVQ